MADSTVSQSRTRVSGRTLVHCAQCNGELWLYASQAKQYKRHFCNMQCRDAYRAEHHWGNPRQAKPRKCDECGKEIYRAPSRATAYTNHFCDDECRNAWRAKNAPKGEDNPNFRGGSLKKCDQCGADTWVTPSKAAKHERHFCSGDCSAKWLSENTRGHFGANFKGGEISVQCAVCQHEFHAPRAEVGRARGKYCSRDCFFKSRDKSIEIACVVCSKTRWISPHKLSFAKYCSLKCKHDGQTKIRTPAQRRMDRRMVMGIWNALRSKKAGRSWESLVGYTLTELMVHLESLFWSGMTWDNIGDWHIDHKRPRSSFSYESPEDADFKSCWCLQNLQPLWAVDNMRKGARLDWEPDA